MDKGGQAGEFPYSGWFQKEHTPEAYRLNVLCGAFFKDTSDDLGSAVLRFTSSTLRSTAVTPSVYEVYEGLLNVGCTQSPGCDCINSSMSRKRAVQIHTGYEDRLR